ncbi:hypothetical protein AGMMS49975_08110 [Clostridia bacterium]|nr:hypothetical protein AGMMS49975_08110 [Clostridia bacterium]
MAKTKIFISVIPFQGQDKEGNDLLKQLIYTPSGNSRLEYGETRFPIIPLINGYTENGDKVRVIAILTDGENYKHNYEKYFITEIDAIVETKNLDFAGIEAIQVSANEDIDAQLALFGKIIDKISDGEDIYACITYGTKPTPIVETMALNYAYRLKKDVSIGCIVYGQFPHKGEPRGKIYDTTALFFMDSIVNKLAEMKVPNPKAAIKLMLEVGDKDE